MKCGVKKCRDEAVRGGYCDVHYWRDKWLDNTDRNNLGIVLFAKMIVPEWVRNDIPDFHKSMYMDFMSLYSQEHKHKYDRLLAEVAFRGAAKTTMSKILLLYTCCFGLEKLIIYCSETHDFAEQDTFEVRKELTTNPHIKHYFGIIKSKGVRGQDGEWTRDAYQCMFDGKPGAYVLARGVGQQVRSVLRNSYRPTLAIINDMYSENGVKTEHTRAESEKWFFTAMFNAVDDIDGKVFFNGTILHQDTVPIKLKSNPAWKYHEYPIMDYEDFDKVLSECKITESAIEIPSKERINELQTSCHLYWPERLDLEYILRKYQEAYKSGKAAGFFQDYFHITTAPDEKPFKVIRYADMTYIRAGDRNWLQVSFDHGQTTIVYEVNLFIGLDAASATTNNAKFTSIIIIAMNQYRQVFVLMYARGKYGLRDEFKAGYRKPGDSDKVELDRSNIQRIGMVDEEIRLVKQFQVLGACVETVQQQQSIFDEINRLMRENNAFHSLRGVKPSTDKIERDADTLGPYFETGSIFLERSQTALIHELEQFPRGVTVDVIDSLQMAVMIAKPSDGADYTTARSVQTTEDEELPTFYVL
jgi:predicted phage terminase large subunit-like protein